MEEFEFLDKTKTVKNLFVGEVKCVLLTLGENGSICYLKDGTCIESKGYKCDAIDTTGAGDGFIGSFLYQLENSNKNIINLSYEEIQKYMDFSNRFCSLSVTKKGAIDSYPTKEKMKRFI